MNDQKEKIKELENKLTLLNINEEEEKKNLKDKEDKIIELQANFDNLKIKESQSTMIDLSSDDIA